MIVFNNLIARTNPTQFNIVLSRNKFISTLVELMNYLGKEGVQEQAVWILDNVAVDGDKYRKRCVEAGMLEALLKVRRSSSVSAVCNSNVLVSGKHHSQASAIDRYQGSQHSYY